MMNDKNEKTLYWTLLSIGAVILVTGLICIIIDWNRDWGLTAGITGYAIALLGLIFEPITPKAIETGTARNIFFTSILSTILACIWILLIDNFTPAIIAVIVLDVILLIVTCCLAYKKTQRAKALEAEFEKANNEKNDA